MTHVFLVLMASNKKISSEISTTEKEQDSRATGFDQKRHWFGVSRLHDSLESDL